MPWDTQKAPGPSQERLPGLYGSTRTLKKEPSLTEIRNPRLLKEEAGGCTIIHKRLSVFLSASERCPIFLLPDREGERFQSLLCLLYGKFSAFKVKNRCFLSSRGFICLVHTFSRQFIAVLIYTVLFRWWDNNSRSTLSHKMVAQEKAGLNLITPSCAFLCHSLVHTLPESKQYRQLASHIASSPRAPGISLVICNLKYEKTDTTDSQAGPFQL